MKRFITLAIFGTLSLSACDGGGDAKTDDAKQDDAKKDDAKKDDTKKDDTKKDDAKTADPGADQAAIDAKWVVCASCHGETGAGDGPAAAALDPKPRNFGDAAWHDKTDDAHISKVILEGGPAVGMNATMPPNPDLKDKPTVLAGLVKKIRGLKK